MLRWVPNDKLEVLGSVAYSKEDDEAPAEVLINTNPATNDGFDSVLSAQLLAKYGVVYDNRFLPPPGRPYSSYATFCRPLTGTCFDNSQGQNSTDANIRVDYEVADKIHLKAIGAYSDYGGYLHQAGDLSPLGYVQGQVFFDVRQYTGELRLNGTSFADKLDWVVGFFDLTAKDRLNGAIDFVIENFTEMDNFKNDSHSGFFHGEYHVTDKWSVSAGARYSTASSTANIDHPGLITGVIPFTVSKSTPDWLLSTSYRFTDDILGYVTAASGSRPPGVTTIVNSIYQLQAIPQEKLVSYEFGMKSEFFDHRFRANMAAFWSDYSKHLATQVQFQCLAQAPPPTPVPLQSDCPPGGALQWYTTVATPATITGFEWEFTAEPIQRLTLDFSGGYNHFIDGVKVPGEPGYIVPGNLPQPEWNMNGGIQYDAKTPYGSVTPRFDWTYLSEQNFNPASSVTAPTAEYTLPGALGVQRADHVPAYGQQMDRDAVGAEPVQQILFLQPVHRFDGGAGRRAGAAARMAINLETRLPIGTHHDEKYTLACSHRLCRDRAAARRGCAVCRETQYSGLHRPAAADRRLPLQGRSMHQQRLRLRGSVHGRRGVRRFLRMGKRGQGMVQRPRGAGARRRRRQGRLPAALGRARTRRGSSHRHQPGLHSDGRRRQGQVHADGRDGRHGRRTGEDRMARGLRGHLRQNGEGLALQIALPRMAGHPWPDTAAEQMKLMSAPQPTNAPK